MGHDPGGRSVGLSARFLSNSGRYQTWICGCVQRALGTKRVQEQHVYSGGLKLQLLY